MKYVFSIIFLYFLIISKSTADEIIHFPDSVFKKYMVNYYTWDFIVDSNQDGEIQESEAEAITTQIIICDPNYNITDITGIKAFKNLSNLIISQNKNLTEVDLSGMEKLKWLSIDQNPKLYYLNISNCPELYDFMGDDNALITIEVSNCPKIKSVYVMNNFLKKIDITGCKSLSSLLCQNNQIKNIIWDNEAKISVLYCQNNNLGILEIKSLIFLNWFNISNNKLIILDVLECTNIEKVYIDSNKLESLSIRNGNNQIIKEFSTLGNPNLKCISVDDAEYSYQNWKNIDTWTEFSEDCNTNVKEKELPNFRIYPNPATNKLTINWENNLEADLRIIDITGKIFMSHTIYTGMNELHLDVSKLSAGKYIVEIGEQSKLLTIE